MQIKNYLERIVKRKLSEVEATLKEVSEDASHPLAQQLKMSQRPTGIFATSLKGLSLAVIAEIKRKSPSRGDLALITEPVKLAKEYCLGGASAISILTDGEDFAGSLDDLRQVSDALVSDYVHVPILRKDFIVHPIQLAEAALSGASSVLLIARILQDKLGDFITEATRIGLETLTEVHDEYDLKFALDANAPIIGINNRNLTTFEVDLTISERLIKQIPDSCIKVAESGIKTVETAKNLRTIGFDAVLIGEALVISNDPGKLIANMRMRHD